MAKVAIIGTTSWGLTLAVLQARKGARVRLWARTREEAKALLEGKPMNPALEGIALPAGLAVTASMRDAMDDADMVILVVPSQTVRQNMKLVSPHLKKSTLIASAAKGLEIETGKRMSEVIAEEIKPALVPNICVISGPNLSQEIIKGLPAVTVVAAEDDTIARKAQRIVAAPGLCVYTNTDVIGVELGGAFKNIIALGAGMADGLAYGDNAKAAFMTRGLTEMSALGVALGANPLTFSGLAGLGDMITTCASPLSRNHYVGVELTRGRKLQEILDSMDTVAEGVSTTLAVWKLAKQLGLEMPITEKIHRVLYDGVDPREAAQELMALDTRHELKGRRWRLFSFLRRKKVKQAQ